MIEATRQYPIVDISKPETTGGRDFVPELMRRPIVSDRLPAANDLARLILDSGSLATFPTAMAAMTGVIEPKLATYRRHLHVGMAFPLSMREQATLWEENVDLSTRLVDSIGSPYLMDGHRKYRDIGLVLPHAYDTISKIEPVCEIVAGSVNGLDFEFYGANMLFAAMRRSPGRRNLFRVVAERRLLAARARNTLGASKLNITDARDIHFGADKIHRKLGIEVREYDGEAYAYGTSDNDTSTTREKPDRPDTRAILVWTNELKRAQVAKGLADGVVFSQGMLK